MDEQPAHSPEAPRAVPEPVLVSACLLGRACTFEGGDNRDLALEAQLARDGLEPVPFCPEESGGLSTPRPAANLTAPAADVLDGAGRVVSIHGDDVTDAFRAGAEGALERCRARGIRRAFLKERSPSCGCAATHVDGALVQGRGVTAELLERSGVRCEGVEGRRPAPGTD
ncbi:MAG: DUF523 domain-containing protein [Planctomycetota bacterium]|nr:DUF523 domain-containing protein [Planctomycetota bacterium]